MAIGFWRTLYLVIKTICYMHLFISKRYFLVVKTVTADRFGSQLNELDNHQHSYPSLYRLESYRINSRQSSNTRPSYGIYTSSQQQQQQHRQQEYIPISELVNLSYPSIVHENKWNTYMNRVNNQYVNNTTANSDSRSNSISNNQSHGTSFSASLSNSVSSSSSSTSLSLLGTIYTPKISYAGESKTEQILKYILTNYKTHERPNENSIDPTIVSVFIHIIDVSSSNVVLMEYTINCYLRQQWQDPRLSWDTDPVLSSSVKDLLLNQQKKQLWLPDLFFRNGKSGFLHDMSQPNYLLRVKSDGQVLYSQKITMVLSCQMYLKKFPMDKQECTVNIGSYGYTIDQLKFVWHHEKPVTIAEDLKLLEFESPQGAYTLDCTKNGTTNTGTYSCLLLVIPLRRLIGSYIVTTYIPEILIVMVSWLGFWIDIKAVPARVTLGLLTLLGLLTESSSVSSQLPKVTYLKAIDVWLTVCLLFVVAALAEFAYAYMMAPKSEGHEWEPEVRELVRVLLTTYTGQVRCCCCYTKNAHHKPVLKLNSQRSQSHQPQPMDGAIKKSNLKVTRGTESDPEFSVKLKKPVRTNRSTHISKSAKARCKICDSYQPVCCTCPTCSRLKCPEAPRRKPTQVKISTKPQKLETMKSINLVKQRQEMISTVVDFSTSMKTLKKGKTVRRRRRPPQSVKTDSCRVLIEPLYKELLEDKQPMKSALKIKVARKYDLKTTFLDSNNNANNNNSNPKDDRKESSTLLNHNHHEDLQQKEELWQSTRPFTECLCLKLNCCAFQQSKSVISRKLNSVKLDIPYESPIDAYSRLIFPASFFLFMFIYWFVYLVLAKD